mmetsp:Transcript_24381/g.23984  ORF Transcript_24381/g.23984 Transcript_24381/m.23984 type:complete len:103 (+) Transcript_24381:1471-1779(+)
MHKILKMIPFNSDTKKMTVVLELEPEKMVRIFTKGASENIIDDCTSYIEKDQKQVEIDLSKREHLKDVVLKQMAKKALRTIALGYKDITMEQYKDLIDAKES